LSVDAIVDSALAEGQLPGALRFPRSHAPADTISDDRVRAMRDRMQAARTRIEIAMQFVMFPEVRKELRGVQSDLAEALAYIGGR
jgi:hypothetical protein